MARKSVRTDSQHVCDDCVHSTWSDIEWNRDLSGLPLTLRCPFYKNGAVGIIRGSKACKLYSQS